MPLTLIQFSDRRKWGDWTFLDLLERNNIQYEYDGEVLAFHSSEARQQAARIWYALTGQERIGVVA